MDELQGAAQATGNVQPQSVGAKLNATTRRQGNTQLGQLGTAAGSSLGSGPSNNGFVAATANIDQSSKNTINVYQFGSGVNFNLKLAGGQGI